MEGTKIGHSSDPIAHVSGDGRVSPQEGRFAVIDVETTGLFPRRGDRVIEIAAILLVGSEVRTEFHSLVQVKKGVSRAAHGVHGIDDAMLADQPTPEHVYPRLGGILGDATLIAHNAPFDIGFLRYEFSRLGQAFNSRFICTLEMSKCRIPGLRNYRLETIYRALFGKLPEDGRRHRALGDARMVAEIWRELRGR